MNTNQYGDTIERGERLYHNGNIEEALAVFDAILKAEPDNVPALNNKGVILNSMGKTPEAIQTFWAVIREDKSNADAVFNLISACLSLAEWEEAKNILLEYGHCLEPSDIATIRADLENHTSAEEAIRHAQLEKASMFDYEKVQAQVNKSLRRKFFFIMGVPKSGTTWIQYLLNMHPNIWCSGEADFNMLMRSLEQMTDQYNNQIIGANAGIGSTNYVLFGREHLNYLFVTMIGVLLSNGAGDAAVECIGSKNPILLKAVQMYADLLPTARFIHIIRDGRDSIVSAWFNNLRINPEETSRRWQDFRRFNEFYAQMWAADVNNGRSFGQTDPDRYFELRYEDLHRNPDQIIQQMLEFLDVDASARMVEHCLQACSFEKLSKGRQRGQEDRDSFFRKGIVGDWKNHYDQDSLDTFMRYGGDLLRALGYE